MVTVKQSVVQLQPTGSRDKHCNYTESDRKKISLNEKSVYELVVVSWSKDKYFLFCFSYPRDKKYSILKSADFN